MNPQDEVLDIISADEIEVADGSLYFEGSTVSIHSNDYAFQSDEIEVVSIIGNIIEFNQNHGASIGHKIDLIGFSQDDGLPYRYI
jgi:triacylglycerol esterase/lipase EstA (alpha/beta hydrolase family)